MIDFPTSPAVDDTVTAPNGIVWKWSGTVWEMVTSPTGGGSSGATIAYVNEAVPAGSISDYIGTVVPTGWLGMTGQTVVDGQTTYANLWAVLPAAMKSGANIILPDTRGRMAVGFNSGDTLFDTIGEVGGSKNAIVVDHSHSILVSGNLSSPSANGQTLRILQGGAGSAFGVMFTGANGDNGTVVAGPASGAVSATNANLPPFITFLKIIRAY